MVEDPTHLGGPSIETKGRPFEHCGPKTIALVRDLRAEVMPIPGFTPMEVSIPLFIIEVFALIKLGLNTWVGLVVDHHVNPLATVKGIPSTRVQPQTCVTFRAIFYTQYAAVFALIMNSPCPEVQPIDIVLARSAFVFA